jgi:hypothetical protein
MERLRSGQHLARVPHRQLQRLQSVDAAGIGDHRLAQSPLHRVKQLVSPKPLPITGAEPPIARPRRAMLLSAVWTPTPSNCRNAAYRSLATSGGKT